MNLMFVDITGNADGQTVLAQPENHELPWNMALGMHIPVAASLTGVFGTSDLESSTDSADEETLNPVPGSYPHIRKQFKR